MERDFLWQKTIKNCTWLFVRNEFVYLEIQEPSKLMLDKTFEVANTHQVNLSYVG